MLITAVPHGRYNMMSTFIRRIRPFADINAIASTTISLYIVFSSYCAIFSAQTNRFETSGPREIVACLPISKLNVQTDENALFVEI